VFRLNPPPPPPEPPKPPAPRLPEIKLSGFTRTGDKWKVLLAVTTDNPDPHGPKLSSYLTLAEGDKKEVGTGDKKGMVELVKLYSGEEKIDIINSGSPMTLSMKDNGFVIPPPVQVASAAVTNVSRAAPIASPAGTTNSLGNPWPVSPAHPMRAGGGASPAHTEPGTDPKPGSGDTPVRGGPSAISPNPSPNRGASNNRSGLIISGSGEDR